MATKPTGKSSSTASTAKAKSESISNSALYPQWEHRVFMINEDGDHFIDEHSRWTSLDDLTDWEIVSVVPYSGAIEDVLYLAFAKRQASPAPAAPAETLKKISGSPLAKVLEKPIGTQPPKRPSVPNSIFDDNRLSKLRFAPKTGNTKRIVTDAMDYSDDDDDDDGGMFSDVDDE